MRVSWAAIGVLGYLVVGCTLGTEPAVAPTETVTPVVVLPAPVATTEVEPAVAVDGETQIMAGYEPELEDATGDVVEGVDPAFDLVSAYAVATDDNLLLRIASAKPMAVDHLTDVRLWVEQDEQQLTVEAKPDHPDRICELTPIGGGEGEELPACVEMGDHLDIRIPLKRLPRWLNTREAYFVSGVSTCCSDEGRERPFDEIEGAQQVWVFDGELPGSGEDDAKKTTSAP